MRSNTFYRTLLTTLPLCLLLLAGCGNSDNQARSHSAPANPAPKATPTTQQPTPTPTPHPAPPTPAGQSKVQPPSRKVPAPGSPTVNSDGIELSFDRASYALHDAIIVTVKNHGHNSIYITSSGTSCTIFQLEMLVNGTWVPQGRCFNVRATPLVQLAASETITQQLQPQSPPAPGQSTSSTTWHAGTYRISLNYNGIVDPDTVGGGHNMTSATFTIN